MLAKTKIGSAPTTMTTTAGKNNKTDSTDIDLHICDLQLVGNRLPPSIAVIDAALVERVCVKGWRGRENFLPTQDLLSASCSRKVDIALSGGRLMEKGLG